MPFQSHILRDALMRHTLELPEQDYYRVPLSLPEKPKPGYVLLSRRHTSPMFRVTWAEGQSVSIMGDDPQVLQKLDKFGISVDVAERSLQHIWNFGLAYVKLRDGYPDAPPVKMPTSVLAGRPSAAILRTPLLNTGKV